MQKKMIKIQIWWLILSVWEAGLLSLLESVYDSQPNQPFKNFIPMIWWLLLFVYTLQKLADEYSQLCYRIVAESVELWNFYQIHCDQINVIHSFKDSFWHNLLVE